MRASLVSSKKWKYISILQGCIISSHRWFLQLIGIYRSLISAEVFRRPTSTLSLSSTDQNWPVFDGPSTRQLGSRLVCVCERCRLYTRQENLTYKTLSASGSPYAHSQLRLKYTYRMSVDNETLKICKHKQLIPTDSLSNDFHPLNRFHLKFVPTAIAPCIMTCGLTNSHVTFR